MSFSDPDIFGVNRLTKSCAGKLVRLHWHYTSASWIGSRISIKWEELMHAAPDEDAADVEAAPVVDVSKD